MRRSGGWYRPGDRWAVGFGKCLFLQVEIGVQADLGGVDADVAEPEGDDAGVDAGVESPHRVGYLYLISRKRLLLAIFGWTTAQYMRVKSYFFELALRRMRLKLRANLGHSLCRAG